jgi:flagellar hook-associated protein 3 FlgL
MQRITTLMTSQMTIADLTQAFDRLSKTQEELSSGKRINKPSDDPYGASRAVQLNGDLAGLTAYSRNVNDGTAWSQSADSALMNINNLAQRVRELVVEAGNDTSGSSARADAAAEIDQLTDAIKQEANTQYAGQYIFSGTATTTAPYQTGAVDTYQGNTATISRQIGPGTSVQISTDISQLLGSGQTAADGKLLNVLRDISADLRGGTAANANALRTTDLANLDSNLDTLSQLEANVGATENRLSLASSRIQDLQTSATKLLSQTQDTDFAQAAVDYSTQQASYNAALRASANIVQSSLLDFLK